MERHRLIEMNTIAKHSADSLDGSPLWMGYADDDDDDDDDGDGDDDDDDDDDDKDFHPWDNMFQSLVITKANETRSNEWVT